MGMRVSWALLNKLTTSMCSKYILKIINNTDLVAITKILNFDLCSIDICTVKNSLNVKLLYSQLCRL